MKDAETRVTQVLQLKVHPNAAQKIILKRWMNMVPLLSEDRACRTRVQQLDYLRPC